MPAEIIANAGADRAIILGQTALLDGSESAASGGAVISTYTWEQISGATCSINNADEAEANVTPPSSGSFGFLKCFTFPGRWTGLKISISPKGESRTRLSPIEGRAQQRHAPDRE